MKTLEEYTEIFGNLRREYKRSKWPSELFHRAPHKPLLLLAVIDLFAQGVVKSNLIELSIDLCEIFTLYWARIRPPDQRGNIALPFFHLERDGFWHFIPQSGKEALVSSASQIRSVNQIRDSLLGVKLDDELYNFFCVSESREKLREALINKNFAPELQVRLLEQGLINIKAYEYSKELLEEARREKPKKVKEEAASYQQSVRDQAFRRAVVTAYRHRCAFCGIRMLTPDGHTVVDAAHIIPWSESRNDRPTNGMALCKLCHWSFDKGMLGVSQEYIVLTSPKLNSENNIPSHLPTLSGRLIIGPEEKVLWPDLESVRWHHKKVFRRL